MAPPARASRTLKPGYRVLKVMSHC